VLLVDQGTTEKAIMYLQTINLDFPIIALTLTTIPNFKWVIRNHLHI